MLEALLEEYICEFLKQKQIQEITTCASIVGLNTKLGTEPNTPSEPKVIKRRKRKK